MSCNPVQNHDSSKWNIESHVNERGMYTLILTSDFWEGMKAMFLESVFGIPLPTPLSVIFPFLF